MSIKRKSGLISILALSFLCAGGLTACGGDNNSSTVMNTISFEKSSVELYIADSVKIAYEVSNEDAAITWKSSDENIATVRRGTIVGKAAGTCKVTAEIENGNTAEIAVTVKDRTITISESEITINLDEEVKTHQLTATSSDEGKVTWSTSDPAIATVEDGLVTGVDVGTATITASRGAAKATCTVTVIKPSRPADYYKLTKLTNIDCVADPGRWHYHVDGSLNTDYSFVEEPIHQNNSLSVKLGTLNLEAKKYFYFRYQPTLDQGKTYTAKFTATMSHDGTIAVSDGKNTTKTKKLTAGVPLTMSYVGVVNAAQPFHIRIDKCEDLQNSKETSLTITDISFTEGKTATDTDTPQESEHANEKEYDLEMMTNANVVLNTGAWYYSCDGKPNVDYSFASTPHYKDGVVTFSFNNLSGQKPFNQLRYQPTLAVGKYYKMTFTVTLSAAGAITYGTKSSNDNTNYTKVELTPGTYTYEFTAQVNNYCPFSIGITPSDWDSPFALTVKDVSVVEVAAPTPDPNNYELAKGTKAETIAGKGKWFYFCDGKENVDYSFDSKPAIKDGKITFAFKTMNASKTTNQLRYQPDLEVGKKFKITFTAKTDKSAKLSYGGESDGTKDYKTAEMTADVEQTLTYSAKVDDDVPFSINFLPNDYTASNKLEVYDITVEEVTDSDTPTTSYHLEKKTKANTISHPGVWTYTADGTKGTDYAFVQDPSYQNGTIDFSFSKMTSGKNYELRYQPTLAVGKAYDVSMTITLSAAGKVLYPDNYKALVFFAAGSKTLTTSSTVSATDPFYLSLKPAEYTNGISLTITNISFTEHVDTPSTTTTYSLTSAKNSEVIADPGVWHYFCDGTKDTNYSFSSAPTYDNGTITFALATMTANKTYQLRYQPAFEVGKNYTATMRVKISAAGHVNYGKESKRFDLNANTETALTYTGTVDGSSPFMLQLKPDDYTQPFTLTVTDITFTEQA